MDDMQGDGWPEDERTRRLDPVDPDHEVDVPPLPPAPTAGQRVRRFGGAVGRAAARGGNAAYVNARRFTHSGGAGESGLSRLLELHAFNTAGDAAVAISLAGTLFFTVPTDEASGQVALFLVLTMLPFAVVAPLIGPFLDRFRRGRRWAIGATLAIRAFCCWVLAGSVNDESPSFFLAALGCLVASKAYGVTRASAVPRLLPEDFTLVKANSRISLTGTGAAAISAPIAGLGATIGAEWALRYAFVLFVIGTILAILLPAKVDSSEGEEQVEISPTGEISRGIVIPRAVVNGLRSNSGLRLMTGFLTIFMAFSLREPPASLGWDHNSTILLGLVVGGAGAGNTLGVVLGNLLKSRDPEKVVVAVLILEVVVAAFVSLAFTWWTAVLLGLNVGLCQSLGKLSLDATIQRDVRESIRTSVFARSETLLQLSWVIGGMAGIGLFTIDATPRVGLMVITAVLIGWLAWVIAKLRASTAPTPPPPHAAPGPPA